MCECTEQCTQVCSLCSVLVEKGNSPLLAYLLAFSYESEPQSSLDQELFPHSTSNVQRRYRVFLELDLLCIKSKVVPHTCFPYVKEILIMFLFIFSIDDHIICNACYTFHAMENGIKFTLENVLCYNCAHRLSCPLEFSML